MSVNLLKELDLYFPSEVQNMLKLCASCADELGCKIYLVGGIVRDILLKKPSFDVDITIEGDAAAFVKILEEKGTAKVIKTQPDLKTVSASVFNNGHEFQIDFASCRKESYPKKGHLPVADCFKCTLKDDILRRDFTINAMAISLNKDSYGKLIDYSEGLKDLKNKKLRVMHEKSFIDDPTRIIRGLKFAVRFDFNLEEHTRFLQADYLEKHLKEDISFFRLKSELKQAFDLNSAKVPDIFVRDKMYKLITEKIPQNLDTKVIESNITKYTKKINQIWLIYFACIIIENETSTIEAILDKLMFTKGEKGIVLNAKNLLLKSDELKNKSADSEIYDFFSKSKTDSVLIFYLAGKNEKALRYIDILADIKLETTGTDLIKLGFNPSDKFKKLLKQTLAQKLDFPEQIKNKTDEINFIKTKYQHLTSYS